MSTTWSCGRRRSRSLTGWRWVHGPASIRCTGPDVLHRGQGSRRAEVPPRGVEPRASAFVAPRSVLLSYRGSHDYFYCSRSIHFTSFSHQLRTPNRESRPVRFPDGRLPDATHAQVTVGSRSTSQASTIQPRRTHRVAVPNPGASW